MAINGDNQSNEIPPIAQKIMFAEEIVNYILQINSLPGILRSTERPVGSSVSIFDDKLRMVLHSINDMFENYTKSIFDFMMDNNRNDIKWFAYYANSAKGKFSYYGLHPKPFLSYCVHLGQLAGKLCAQEVNEAPCTAVRCIVDAMDFDVFNLGASIVVMIESENRLLGYMSEKPSSYGKDNAFVERKTKENVHRKILNMEKLSDNINADLGESQHTNPYNVSSSSHSIGVPGSSREKHSYSSHLSEEENKHRKRPRLDPDI